MSFPTPEPRTGSIYVPAPEQPFTLQQMTQPAPPEPSWTPQRKRPRWPILMVVGVAILIVAGGVALAVAFSGGASPAAQASPSPSWSSVFGTGSTTRAAAAPAYTPTSADFKLEVKVIEKKCFGSAGCNITFRVELTYIGLPLDPSRTYEVVYRIDGAEDAYINSLKVTGTSYEHDDRELVQVKSSKSVLAAVVTDVNER